MIFGTEPLRDWRCPRCRRLLCRCVLPAGGAVEIHCRHCHVRVAVTAGSAERLTESVLVEYHVATWRP